jgi:uncharacterized membrane protein
MDKKTTSVMAITGFILAIFSLMLSWIPFINSIAYIPAILGLVFGIIGLVKIKKNKNKGKALAIAAIIMSLVTFNVVLVTQQMLGNAINTNIREGGCWDTSCGSRR